MKVLFKNVCLSLAGIRRSIRLTKSLISWMATPNGNVVYGPVEVAALLSWALLRLRSIQALGPGYRQYFRLGSIQPAIIGLHSYCFFGWPSRSLC